MDRIDLLRLFITIADCGSMSAAARAKNLSTSTVTLGLQRLEDRVAMRLVNRTTRRLSLTPEGERFLLQSRRILGELDEALDELSENGALKGEIRLTCTNDFGRNRLTAIIDDFLQDHPGVRFSLVLSDTVVDLTQGGFDFGIRIELEQESSRQGLLLIQGTRHIVASPGYWQERGRPYHPNELRDHNCLILARPGAPQALWPFQENGREFTVRVSGNRAASDGGALRDWAIGGAGVVFKWDFDIVADISAGRLETCLEGYSVKGYNLYAVYPTASRPNRRTTVFLDYLAKQLESH